MHPSLNRVGDSLRQWFRRWRRAEPVHNAEALRRFLQTRASHIAQMTLYGYLRTRAGTRFPELFENDAFVVSMNIAKWHVWLACVSDLAVHAGTLLRRSGAGSAADIGALMSGLVDEILEETGTPAEAGAEFAGHAQRVQARRVGGEIERHIAMQAGIAAAREPVSAPLRAMHQGNAARIVALVQEIGCAQSACHLGPVAAIALGRRAGDGGAEQGRERRGATKQ